MREAVVSNFPEQTFGSKWMRQLSGSIWLTHDVALPMEDCRASGRIKPIHTHWWQCCHFASFIFYFCMFPHHLHKTAGVGWGAEHKEEVHRRASPQRQDGANWIDDLISQPIKFKSIANCRLGCSSISYTIRRVTKQNNSYRAILSLTVHLAASWCTSAPWQSLKAPRPWIMHRNFITATKQLMGRALAQINSGIAGPA